MEFTKYLLVHFYEELLITVIHVRNISSF